MAAWQRPHGLDHGAEALLGGSDEQYPECRPFRQAELGRESPILPVRVISPCLLGQPPGGLRPQIGLQVEEQAGSLRPQEERAVRNAAKTCRKPCASLGLIELG